MPTAPDALDAVLADLRDSWTAAEAASAMGVHVTTIYRLIKSGRLRTIAMGSGAIRRTLVKIPRSAVAELLNAGTQSEIDARLAVDAEPLAS